MDSDRRIAATSASVACHSKLSAPKRRPERIARPRMQHRRRAGRT
ncbi:hypothetical protein BSLA_01r0177 [Burkholderia stabilis]|nr:hypothetical protein BSLA_01r0177 [Burkholderia stabilis]